DMATSVPMNRLVGNHHRILLFSENDFSLAEDVGPQAAVPIRQIGPHLHGPGLRIGAGADPGYGTLDLDRVAVGVKANGLPEGQLGSIFLSEIECEPHLAHIRDNKEYLACVHNFAGHSFT